MSKTVKLSERQKHLMRHALGLMRSNESYRNHYITPETTEAASVWRELIGYGFATVEPQSGMALYRVTPAGRLALHPADSVQCTTGRGRS